ncbi:calcium-activated chloride channel regulator 2-like isoform X1 [Anas platyrhynchos]|uniref:calcium-activated chloride channel regulator 2-like isoform X1 n=2 Tax=Anas platyrhynchos TaxID=8839 RepID=UPI003AF21F60
MTVTSRAANSTIPPVAVKTRMSKDINYYPSAMVVYVQVSHGFSPVLGASVTAVISPENGDPISLELLDNGAGSDIVKNDGIYSKYLFSFPGNGRYSLKAHVQANRTIVPQTAKLWSHAMYIPGYVENGKLKMNPSRPPAIKSDIQVRRGGFHRTAVGESFIISAVPMGPHADVFPPCKIIDLVARIEDDKVILSWTAPGNDFDKGRAASYEIRISESPLELRDSFYNTGVVNTSTLSPQHAGCKEIFAFKPEAFTTGNITIIYVAMRAIDDFLHSELSNIAQAVKFVPPMVYPTSNTEFSFSTILLLVFGLLTVVCITVSTTLCLVKKTKKKTLSENAAKFL